MRIAVFDDWNGFARSSPHLDRLRAHGSVTVFGDHPSTDEVRARLHEVDAVILWRDRTPLSAEDLAAAPDLQVVVQTGNSSGHLDLAALEARGITLLLPPFLFGEHHPTAEFTMACILGLAHRLTESDRAMRRTAWPTTVTRSVRGRTLGLVGYGRMAHALAGHARDFGMRVLAWSRSLEPGTQPASGAEVVALEELLASAEFVSVQLRLSPETRGFLTSERLALLRPDAYFVNTGRAAIVDGEALLRMLRERRIAGAALDVYDEEPLAADHPLRTLDNVVLTPHIGWTQEESLDELLGQAVHHLDAHLRQTQGG